jgi:hypothetical protein
MDQKVQGGLILASRPSTAKGAQISNNQKTNILHVTCEWMKMYWSYVVLFDCAGYKAEFLVHQVTLCGAFILLALTAHIVPLFLLAAAAGMRRASVSVVPYKLMNDVIHEEVRSV